MAKGTFPIGARTFQDGDTQLPEVNLPLGCIGANLTLDVGSMLPGQVLWFFVELWKGSSWSPVAKADFIGPWRDKQNVLHTDSSLIMGFGNDAQGNPIPSQAGWKARATVTAINGPIDTAGGSLVVL